MEKQKQIVGGDREKNDRGLEKEIRRKINPRSHLNTIKYDLSIKDECFDKSSGQHFTGAYFNMLLAKIAMVDI